MVTRRAALARRLTALEANRPGVMTFILDDRRRVDVPILTVLKVFAEGARWVYGEDDPEAPREPDSPYLALLGRAVATPDDSMLAASVVHLARRVRARREAIPGQVVDD